MQAGESDGMPLHVRLLHTGIPLDQVDRCGHRDSSDTARNRVSTDDKLLITFH
jgi:hypothetical protein